MAVARPIPELPPVMTATLPSKSLFISVDLHLRVRIAKHPASMHWSQLFIPTLRDDPAEAEVASHKLLLRAGYIRQLSAGIYSHLFLAQRSLLKITAIVREEMDSIGGQEMLLPALNPAEVWQESGRWSVMGDNLFK